MADKFPETHSDILFLVTGGTLDKIHDPINEVLIFPEATHMNRVLAECYPISVPPEDARLNPQDMLTFSVKTILMMDSWDMMDTDRQKILDACEDAEQDKIVITHGTSTMPQTAEFLKKAKLDKTIVLFGSMRPYSLGDSDTKFNLGMAVATAHVAAPGVYLTMGGRIFTAGHVYKDHYAGVFKLKKDTPESADTQRLAEIKG